jgi:hypothetical protein
MILYGYTSRNIPAADIFKDVLHRRMNAKREGDIHKAEALKLICNSTYGAMLNEFNPLYDPQMGRNVCITGQLFMIELAAALVNNCHTLRLIQANTDSIMVSFDEREYTKVRDITGEWQERTGFTLEEEAIEKIVQKDCNNYAEVKKDGKIKTKGAYLTYGISSGGAWNINKNAVIVKKALVNYFANDVPPEQTIAACDNIFEFQFVAKGGIKYNEVYHMVDGEPRPVQRVNRVYAAKDRRYGKLYKIKASNGSKAKIENLPPRCVIDNDNQLTLDDVDRQFYISMARKRIDEFLGIKRQKISKRTWTKFWKDVFKILEV